MSDDDPQLPIRHSLSRRDFLQRSFWGAAASWTIPGFLDNTLFQLDARAASHPSAASQGGPILVIMELGGGNDSLNTVIPYASSIYTGARPTIALGEQHGVQPLGTTINAAGQTETLGLHPNLARMRQYWLEGQLAIVNGVGYPNPNLSHFTSFDYWYTAEPNGPVRDGWLGRYFDNQCNGCTPPAAIDFSNRPTRALRSMQGTSPTISIADPYNFEWRDLQLAGREASLEDLYRRLIGLDHPVDQGISADDEVLSYVQRSAHNAMISTRTVANALQQGGQLLFPNWPGGNLAQDFKDVATMIHGGIDTSIYYIHQAGYDTHSNQILNDNPLTGSHANLLGALDAAMGAFVEEMKLQGNWNRVLIFTLSEFGRKVIENGSSGTDHGAAESLFVLGGGVNGGRFFGQFPDLAAEARIRQHSLVHNVDFRTVYRTVLERWMQVPGSAINAIFPSRPADFAPLDFI